MLLISNLPQQLRFLFVTLHLQGLPPPPQLFTQALDVKFQLNLGKGHSASQSWHASRLLPLPLGGLGGPVFWVLISPSASRRRRIFALRETQGCWFSAVSSITVARVSLRRTLPCLSVSTSLQTVIFFFFFFARRCGSGPELQSQ